MRRVLTAEQLLEALNRRLAGYVQCHGCRFLGPILPLRVPDEDGVNWSRRVALTCSGRTTGVCYHIAERVIQDIAREYNVRGPAESDPWRRP